VRIRGKQPPLPKKRRLGAAAGKEHTAPLAAAPRPME
jgi:hypothetical protein